MVPLAVPRYPEVAVFKYIQTKVFSLYERPVLRNWFYTFAFAVFVPVGFRFAMLAWTFGQPFDRVMTIVGGVAVGITTVVTLLRIWAVPPRRTVDHFSSPEHHEIPADNRPNAGEILSAVRGNSARSREFARAARALGSTRSLYH
jgi:hypothetical protein